MFLRVIDIFMLLCCSILFVSILIYFVLSCFIPIIKKQYKHSKTKFTIIKVEKIETDDHCTICLEGGKQIQLPCGHTFHHECLYDWFEHPPPTCPICRRDYTDILLI